jgi:hypothetical protein
MWPGFWQLIRNSSMSTSARSFNRSPPTIQPSFPELSLVMTLRQSNNPPNGKAQTHWDWKKWDRWRTSSTAWSLSIKNLSWQGKQSIPHTTMMFYDDCMKMCKTFVPNFAKELTVASWQCTSSHLLFTREFLTKENCHPPPTLLAQLGLPPFLSASLIKDTTNLTQLRWSRQNHRQCWTSSHRMNSRMHLEWGRY